MKWFFLTFLIHSFLSASILPLIEQEDQLPALFPQSIEQLQEFAKQAQNELETSFETLLKIPEEERTFENTIRFFDQIAGKFLSIRQGVFEVLSFVSKDPEIRSFSFQTAGDFLSFYQNMLISHPEIYRICSNYIQTTKENLSDEQKYYIQKLLKRLENQGLHLPEETRKNLICQQRRLNELAAHFQKNVHEDQSSVKVFSEELEGLPYHFISQLPLDYEGKLTLTCDYPVVFPVLAQCKKEKTRRKMSKAFFGRAFPENIPILEEIIQLRDQIAKQLGARSYNHFILSNLMVQTPERAENFLNDLISRSLESQEKDLFELKQSLPLDVALSDEGKIFYYDNRYIRHQYDHLKHQIDRELIKEYFPLQRVLQAAAEIFGTFFDLSVEIKSIQNLWDDSLYCLKVTREEQLLGFILLDLIPRPAKYGHACECTIVPSWDGPDHSYPTVALVIANFSKPTSEKPSLLNLKEVRTFFHELGHAFHDLLGRSEMIFTTGTNVERDFVEMPSQILEEWLWQPEMIQRVSSHYLTQEKLPQDIIDRILKSRAFGFSDFIQEQCFYSFLSLEFFKEGSQKNTEKILADLHKKYRFHYAINEDYHFHTSFLHLDEYGPAYYGYLWARVIAADIFEKIKKEGFLNPEVGREYTKKIIGRGGNEDPNSMIEKFLGRKPNLKAFLKCLRTSEK